MTREERFWVKVEKSDKCWTWTGAITSGYGSFWNGERSVYAHRYSFELAMGEIPAGKNLDHLCRNPSCVRPSHLEAVTQRENLLRGQTTVPAVNSAKTHCPRGNVYDEANTGNYKNGRVCRRCAREAMAAKRSAGVSP